MVTGCGNIAQTPAQPSEWPCDSFYPCKPSETLEGFELRSFTQGPSSVYIVQQQDSNMTLMFRIWRKYHNPCTSAWPIPTPTKQRIPIRKTSGFAGCFMSLRKKTESLLRIWTRNKVAVWSWMASIESTSYTPTPRGNLFGTWFWGYTQTPPALNCCDAHRHGASSARQSM